MEFNPLYLKYLFLAQCFCVSLGLIEGGAKFPRVNQSVTFECPFGKQNFKEWKVDDIIITRTAKTKGFEANVLPSNVSIINITPLQKIDVTIVCESTTGEKTRFYAVPLFNDNGNLYPSSKTPNAIKDKKFTLKCNVEGSRRIWFTGNGTLIARYTETQNQNYSKYFGSRQETSCQYKICTLSIINVSLAEDNMSIICSTGIHTSMFNITVFVLPKSVTIKSISNTVPVENQNKSYECLIKDTNPEFSVFWLITKNDGTQKNVTQYISNKTSKSGKLSTLSSELTLTLNKKFKKLQCVAYFPGKNEFDNHSKELDLHIKYSPENMILDVSGGKVCVDTPTKFRCSWKGGNPPASVTLEYEKYSNTSKEEVEINVIPSKSHQTVKCRGIHIAANVSREKNLTIYYPPNMVEIKADEPFLEGDKGILHCKARNGYPEKYSYRWDPSNKTSQNFTFPQLNRTHNNEVYTCYASNKCSKGELHKTHWINVEYSPDITAPENVTLFEDQASIINCSAKGNPTPEVWLEDKNRNFLSNSILTFNRKNISRVFCTAIAKSEKNGNLTNRKEINILFKYPPQVNIHISNEPNKIIISCTASGGNPATHKYELKQKWGNTTKNTYNKEVLPINNPSFNNTGTWECHVINDDFRVIKSSNYKIPVKAMFSSVLNVPKKRNVSNGETVILKQCFYSHPKSDVKWQKNEESIDSNEYLITDYLPNEFPFKGNCTSLKLEDIKDDDIGTYTLTVENSIGKETVVFTLRYKKKQEITKEIIIGCTVGIVLLIIMGLLTYKFYKRRGVKRNKETSSAKGTEDNYATISDEALSAENNYATIPDEALNAARANAISSKPNTNEEQYAEASGPSYLELKPADMVGTYVNVSKKPTGMDGTYVNVSKKPTDLDDAYVNVLKKPSGYQ